MSRTGLLQSSLPPKRVSRVGVRPRARRAAVTAQLDTITAGTTASCPELPSLWMVAQVEAESGWDPTAFSADRNGGSAGFYQLNQANWRGAGAAAKGPNLPHNHRVLYSTWN